MLLSSFVCVTVCLCAYYVMRAINKRQLTYLLTSAPVERILVRVVH